jgi:hypothetical protein
MFLYASSALPGVVQQLIVRQSRGMAYVFPSSTVECVIYVFCNILAYSNGFLSWLVYLFYTDSCVIFCVGPRLSVFLWMRLSVCGEFTLHSPLHF